MRRIPVVATLLVLAAVAAMIGLGMWQLQRAQWKEALLAQYKAALGEPLIDGLHDPRLAASGSSGGQDYAFRRAAVTCVPAAAQVQIGGRNRAGATGYRTIRSCETDRNDRLMVDIGWSAAGVPVPSSRSELPIRFVGRLIPDPQLAARVFTAGGGTPIPLLLVAETPAPGFQPSVPPSIDDIPNNHRGYAVQWFLFAGVATIIYLLALRRHTPR